MTTLHFLIGLFVCALVATAALIWIARHNTAPVEPELEVDCPCGCGMPMSRVYADRFATELNEREYDASARIHRVTFDASGVPIECTPVVCPSSNVVTIASRDDWDRAFGKGFVIGNVGADDVFPANDRDINGETAADRAQRVASGPIATCVAPGVWDEATEVAR